MPFLTNQPSALILNKNTKKEPYTLVRLLSSNGVDLAFTQSQFRQPSRRDMSRIWGKPGVPHDIRRSFRKQSGD
jgi:hypothetical protein